MFSKRYPVSIRYNASKLCSKLQDTFAQMFPKAPKVAKNTETIKCSLPFLEAFWRSQKSASKPSSFTDVNKKDGQRTLQVTPWAARRLLFVSSAWKVMLFHASKSSIYLSDLSYKSMFLGVARKWMHLKCENTIGKTDVKTNVCFCFP